MGLIGREERPFGNDRGVFCYDESGRENVGAERRRYPTTHARAHLPANSYRRSMYIHCVCIYREKFSGCAAVSFSFLNHLLLSPSSFILLLRLPRTIVVRFPSHRHQSIVLIVVIIHTATRRGEEDSCVCVCVSDDEDIVVVVSRSEHRGPKGTPGNEF